MIKLNRQQLPKLMEKITYSELVELKGSSKLVPGLWYRITDYEFVTHREDIQSAGHQFDIIVLATDKDELSEDALAATHEGDDYFSTTIDFEPNEDIYNLIINGEPEDVVNYYIISVDGYPIDSYGGTIDDPRPDPGDAGVFDVDYRELDWKYKPGTDTLVPVLWDECSDGMLYNDCYYYWGDREVDGVRYNLWVKYGWYDGGEGTEEFPLDEDDREFIGYMFLSNPIITPVKTGPILTWVYDLYIDDFGGYRPSILLESDNFTTHNNGGKRGDSFTKTGYATAYGGPYEGQEVPVLYKSDPLPDDWDHNDSPDTFYYYGKFEFDGETYDMWAKWDNSSYDGTITPEGLGFANSYALTQEVVNENTLTFIDNIEPQDYSGLSISVPGALNRWELKYSLENDASRFDWAEPDGKGVIYYMKDEYGNEAPYDFKNVKFKRYGISRTSYQVVGPYATEGGGTTTVRLESSQTHITSGWCKEGDYGISVDYDRSGFFYTFSEYAYNSDVDYSMNSNCCNNVIEPYIYDGELHLNDIVISQASNNIFKNNCHNITALAVDNVDTYVDSNYFENSSEVCMLGAIDSNNFNNIYSVILDSCQFNKFEGNNGGIVLHNSYKNTFELGSSNIHIIDNGARCNTFGEESFDIASYWNENNQPIVGNIFGPNCSHIVIFHNCKHNTFDGNCSNMCIGDNTEACRFGSYSNDIKINGQCKFITTGNNCSNIYIDHGCEYVSIDDGSSSVEIGNHLGSGCCKFIKLGYNCKNIKLIDWSENITFGNNISNVTLGSDTTGTSYNILRNITYCDFIANKQDTLARNTTNEIMFVKSGREVYDV